MLFAVSWYHRLVPCLHWSGQDLISWDAPVPPSDKVILLPTFGLHRNIGPGAIIVLVYLYKFFVILIVNPRWLQFSSHSSKSTASVNSAIVCLLDLICRCNTIWPLCSVWFVLDIPTSSKEIRVTLWHSNKNAICSYALPKFTHYINNYRPILPYDQVCCSFVSLTWSSAQFLRSWKAQEKTSL